MNWTVISEKQPQVARILKNSIQNERVSHGYLFKGGKGVGKEEVAIHFIKRFFCSTPIDNEPCNNCSHCKRIGTESNNHPDFHIVRPDGNSIKIEQIRELQKEFNWKSVEGEKKAYLVVDAEKMTSNSANGLLKFLEEPTQHSIAILLTSNPQRILTTIKSRCQEISFKPLKASVLVAKLVEKGIDRDLALIASELTNDFEKASILAKDEWFENSLNLVKKLAKEIYNNPHEAVLLIQKEWIDNFKEKEQQQTGLELLLRWYRDILMHKLDSNIIFVKDKVQIELQNYSILDLEEITSEVLRTKSNLISNANHQMVMEQLVIFITSKVIKSN